MSNVPGTIRNGLKSKGDKRLPYCQAGWEDARNGRPFNYELTDRVSRVYGHAYELARHRVITLKALNIAVPAWNAANSLPPKVSAAIKKATSINVDCKRQGVPVFYATPIEP